MENLNETVNKNYIPPAHWDFLTPFYDVGCILLGFGSGFRHRIIQDLNLSGTEKILDAGCGTGTLLIMLKNLYPSIITEGLDPDEKALKIAIKKSKKSHTNIIFHCSTMDNMPFESSSFDIVVSSLTFHHIQQDDKLASLKECYRILKPQGRMLLVDFGPPDSYLLNRASSKIFSLFEPIEDGRKGRIPELMSEAGFYKVNEAGKYLYGITFYKGYKNE